MPRGVGAPDDGGEMIERRVSDLVNAQDRVERAALAFVREFDAVDVVRRGARLFGYGENLILGHIDELRVRIDEAADQPWAGNAVDLWTLPRHPLAGTGPEIAARRQALRNPTLDAAF